MDFAKKSKKDGIHRKRAFNITFPFLALSILSASTGNVRTLWFYLGLLFLSTWGLWGVRSRRFSLAAWLGLLALAGLAGYLGQMGLHGLHSLLEKKATRWFMSVGAQDDPYRASTAIGAVGKLKESDAIVIRVKPEAGSKPPTLLRTASYDTYRASTWFAHLSQFRECPPDKNGINWIFDPKTTAGNHVTIFEYLKDGKGILKLPTGSAEATDLPVHRTMGNRFGAVKVEEGPGFLSYTVRYGRTSSMHAPPGDRDLTVPLQEKSAIEQIARELKISSMASNEALNAVHEFFRENFRYSLVLGGDAPNRNVLGEFLSRSRSGNCEFFATASVLILRAAGIPARYAVGYAVDEFSRLEDRYIVRDRHAHAWALAYVDGVWRDFDTTPSSWVKIEKDNASLWEPLSDLTSWCMFKISESRWQEGGEHRRYILWFLVLLALFLAFKFLTNPMRRTRTEKPETRIPDIKKGEDSEFYLVDKRLAELGFQRHPSEATWSWLAKLKRAPQPPISNEILDPILDLHYRYRFDPLGISESEREKLRENVHQWLKKHLI